MSFPYWECLEWLYRHICRHCKDLDIRRPRNKYADVADTYLSPTQEKKKKGIKDKDAQASYAQTP